MTERVQHNTSASSYILGRITHVVRKSQTKGDRRNLKTNNTWYISS